MRLKKLFIGVLMKKEKKEKKKDNQYKLKKAMAIAIGLKKKRQEKQQLAHNEKNNHLCSGNQHILNVVR